MNNHVYMVRKFDLIGRTLYTYKLMPELIQKEKNIFLYKGTNDKYPKSDLFELTTSLSEYKNLFNEDENEFLPYFADVTEDLPSSIKFQPKTYKNCQLMVEKHGAYLQFYHEPTKQILRIAINSNTYYPVTNLKLNS